MDHDDNFHKTKIDPLCVIDVFIPQNGIFELSDTEINEKRFSNVRYYRIISGSLVVFTIFSGVSILFTFIVSLFWLFGVFLPIILVYLGLRKLGAMRDVLGPDLASMILILEPKTKDLLQIKSRYWLTNSYDEFTETDVRFNQSIGYRVVWQFNGTLTIELIVDRDFPGTKVFETYDFYTLAELIVILELCTPNLNKWYYVVEDGKDWSLENKNELNEDIISARVPWKIQDYFSEL